MIEQVMEYKYLVITLPVYGKPESEVEEQLNTTNKKNWIEPRDVWTAVVRPIILTKAAETRPDTTKTKRILETAETNILRKIDNKTLIE